jgi:hypothetical protein
MRVRWKIELAANRILFKCLTSADSLAGVWSNSGVCICTRKSHFRLEAEDSVSANSASRPSLSLTSRRSRLTTAIQLTIPPFLEWAAKSVFCPAPSILSLLSISPDHDLRSAARSVS